MTQIFYKNAKNAYRRDKIKFFCLYSVLAFIQTHFHNANALTDDVSFSNPACMDLENQTGSQTKQMTLSSVESIGESEYRASLPFVGPKNFEKNGEILPKLGDSIFVVRCLSRGSTEIVGKGQVVGYDSTNLILHIESQVKSEFKHAFRENLYPRPMVGDLAVAVSQSISKVNKTLPVGKFYFSNAYPSAHNSPKYEASQEGADSGSEPSVGNLFLSKSDLQNIEEFIKINLKNDQRIFVEVHDLQNVKEASAAVTSQIRANYIRSFLINSLGIDNDRIVALGFGSTQLNTGFSEVNPSTNLANASHYILRIEP